MKQSGKIPCELLNIELGQTIRSSCICFCKAMVPLIWLMYGMLYEHMEYESSRSDKAFFTVGVILALHGMQELRSPLIGGGKQ